MTRNDKFNIQRRSVWRNFWQRLSSVPDLAAVKLLFVALYLAGMVWVWSKQEAVSAYAQSVEFMSPIMLAAMTHVVPAYLIVGGAVLAVLMIYPFGRKAAQDQLRSIGLVNRAEMVPELLRKRQDKEHPRVTVWEFRNQSIPLAVWEEKQAALEAALDVSIVKIIYGKSRSRVLIYAAPTQTSLPDILRWSDSYLSSDSFVLTLGESLLGPVTVNLAHIPHILLGGSTGSGKSVLLKLLLMQALHKGAEVYIADFKGGVDFSKVWHEKCRMCFTEAELLDTLDNLVRELEQRKGLLAKTGCPNLDAYNEATGENLPRLVFGCDEVVEVLDRTGRSKGDKELLAQIESRLATIARLGRAPPLSPDRSRIIWTSVCAVGRTMSSLRSFWTTPVPQNRFPRTQGDASSLGTAQCSRAICSMKGSSNGGNIMPRKKKPNDHGTGIPYHEVEALARVLLPEKQAFFESEEGQREFAEWKAQHQTSKAEQE